jgi:hypothetical protein
VPISVEELADQLYADVEDVKVLVEQIVDLHEEELPDNVAADVRMALDPHGERTIP